MRYKSILSENKEKHLIFSHQQQKNETCVTCVYTLKPFLTTRSAIFCLQRVVMFEHGQSTIYRMEWRSWGHTFCCWDVYDVLQTLTYSGHPLDDNGVLFVVHVLVVCVLCALVCICDQGAGFTECVLFFTYTYLTKYCW